MPQKLLTDLPADAVQHILARIELAYHIARAAPTCKVVGVAVRNVIRVRGFSGEIVALDGSPPVPPGGWHAARLAHRARRNCVESVAFPRLSGVARRHSS